MSHKWTCTLKPGHSGPCKPGNWPDLGSLMTAMWLLVFVGLLGAFGGVTIAVLIYKGLL